MKDNPEKQKFLKVLRFFSSVRCILLRTFNCLYYVCDIDEGYYSTVQLSTILHDVTKDTKKFRSQNKVSYL